MSGDLPAGWVAASLGDVIAPRSARADPADYPDAPYVGLEQVEPHTNRLLGTVPAGTMASASAAFKAGDVLYGRMRPYLNKVVSPSFDGLASAEFIVMPIPHGIASEFLLQRLTATDFTRFACSQYEGDRPRVKFDQLANFELHLPPAAEQTRIVAKLEELLSDLDTGVAELKAAQAKLQHYRQSLLKAAVEGSLTAAWREAQPAPEETGADLLARILRERRARWEAQQLAKFEAQGKTPPKGWHTKYPGPAEPNHATLSSLPASWCWATTELAGDVLLGRQRAPQYLTGRWPQRYLRVANIKDDWIDFSDVETMDFDEAHFVKYRLMPGDILVSEGQSPELVGQSAIFRGHPEPLCFQKTLHRFRAALGVTLPEYAQLVFRAHVYGGVFRALASITTNIAHLTLEKFSAAPFPLPPLAEQIEIVALVEAQMSRLAELEKQLGAGLRQSTAQRQNLLRAAFAGQLVPQDPAEEPAAELLARIRSQRPIPSPAAPTARRPRANARSTPC